MVRKALTITAALLFLNKLADKLLGKAKFKSMVLEKQYLQNLLQEYDFEKLSFASMYDDISLGKDKVALVGYEAKTSGGQMKKKELQVFGEGREFNSDRNYSSYHLTKANLENLLSHFQDPQIKYVVFEPTEYPDNKKFVAYNLLPADEDRNIMDLNNHANEIARNVQPAYADTAGAGMGMQPMSLTTSLSLSFSARMNPSPPATSSYESSI